jgi:hypothetical protein
MMFFRFDHTVPTCLVVVSAMKDDCFTMCMKRSVSFHTSTVVAM